MALRPRAAATCVPLDAGRPWSRWTSWSSSRRVARADVGARRARGRRGGPRSATTTRVASPRRARAGSVRWRARTRRSAPSASLESVEEERDRGGRGRGSLRGQLLAGAARPPTPTRSRPTTCSSWPRFADPTRGSGRIGRLPEPSRCARSPSGSAPRCPETAHGVRVAGDPDAPGAARSPCAAGRATSCSTAPARSGRTSTSPPTCATTPPRSCASTRGARPGRRRPLGGGVDLAAGPPAIGWWPALGDTVEVHVSTHQHRSVDLPGLNRRGAPAESRPVRPAEAARRAGARHPPRRACATSSRRSPRPLPSRSSSARRADARRRSPRPAGRVDDLTAEQKRCRRRRRAGQGPTRARPGHDRRRLDHRPQGARADARRAGVAASAGSPTSRTPRSR